MKGSVTFNGSRLLSGSIEAEGKQPVIEELRENIISNGIYNYEKEEGVDGYYPVTINVNVPSKEPVISPLSVTRNGTYIVPEEVDGYAPVEVNVPEPVLISKTITENGTYLPGVGIDGYNEVIVNVQSLDPVIDYYAKNIILVNDSGTMQGYVNYDKSMVAGEKYALIVNFRGTGINYNPVLQMIRADEVIQYGTADYYINVAGQNLTINVKTNQIRCNTQVSRAVVVSLIKIPEDIIYPF